MIPALIGLGLGLFGLAAGILMAKVDTEGGGPDGPPKRTYPGDCDTGPR